MESTKFALLWNNLLSAVTVFNVSVWIVIVVRAKPSPSSPPSSSSSPPSFWDRVWTHRRLLALMFVVACGVRSVYPRQDGDRLCMWDHVLSPPLIGRSLAYVAELCFCALICATLVRCIAAPGVRTLANISLVANFVAQNCCTYSVLTRNQIGHVIEESIWLLTALTMWLYVAWACWKGREGRNNGNPNNKTSASLVVSFSPSRQQAMTFLHKGMLIGGGIYVVFMTVIDVPMYLRRTAIDAANGTVFSTVLEGFSEVARCKVITAADTYWIEEMPWMTGYFTSAVWAVLWIANVEIVAAARVGADGKGVGRKKRV